MTLKLFSVLRRPVSPEKPTKPEERYTNSSIILSDVYHEDGSTTITFSELYNKYKKESGGKGVEDFINNTIIDIGSDWTEIISSCDGSKKPEEVFKREIDKYNEDMKTYKQKFQEYSEQLRVYQEGVAIREKEAKIKQYKALKEELKELGAIK